MSPWNPRNPLWVIAVVALAVGAQSALAKKPIHRMTDDERGELLYERHCVQCHGPTAAGNGLATQALVADVPDLRGALSEDARPNNMQLVLRGQGAMPGYAQSFDQYDARRVLRWMEKVGPKGALDWPEEPADAPEADAKPATGAKLSEKTTDAESPPEVVEK